MAMHGVKQNEEKERKEKGEKDVEKSGGTTLNQKHGDTEWKTEMPVAIEENAVALLEAVVPGAIPTQKE